MVVVFLYADVAVPAVLHMPSPYHLANWTEPVVLTSSGIYWTLGSSNPRPREAYVKVGQDES